MAQPAFRRASVELTDELKRVIALPRRVWQDGYGASIDEMIAVTTGAFARPGGKMKLRAVQAAALCEAHSCGGLVCPMGVGSGKTLLSFLLAHVMDSKRPLLLVPAKLRHKTEREYHELQRDWVLPRIRIVSYEFLSREQNAHFLNEYEPDLIVGDEGHKLRNPKAAVTRRVARYVRERAPKVVIMSGTFTRRSIMDYWHILRWCLGDVHMPLPCKWEEAVSWSDALDIKDGNGFRTAPGALYKLCGDGSTAHGGAEALSKLRDAYRRRLVETPGVVATMESAVDCSIYINSCDEELDHLEPYFKTLREQWETPDGHPFSEAVDLWRHARELVCGFYYVWDPRPPIEWLMARKMWCQFVREVLKHSRKIDTELQVAKAVASRNKDLVGIELIERGVDLLANWKALRPTFEPNIVPRWVDDVTLKFAKEWMHNHNGLVWVEHKAFGERLAEMSGCRYYGAQGMAADGHRVEDETKSCILSIAANAEGRNLQRYNKNLVVSCPPSGSMWEQLMGRTHRPGQMADEVMFDVFLACKEQWNGMQRAIKDARFIEETTGSRQKLNIADIDIPTPDDIEANDSPLWG